MRTSFRQLSAGVTGLALCALLLAGCNNPNSTVTDITTSDTPIPANTIAIDANTQLFTPFITVVDVNTTITISNADSAAHAVKSVPVADPSEAAFVNPDKPIAQTLQGGGKTTLTFTKPGLYDLYDDTQATIDKTYHRVAANKDAAGFPYAAEAVIWVKGTIPGLAATAKNTVIAGNDAFQLDFMGVKVGGTGMWHNYDSDPHYINVAPSFGGLNPAKLGDNINKVLGAADAPPNGATKPLTLTTPGLYYYYCSAHADFDTTLNRAKAHNTASIFPMVMEGFVLVG